MVQETLKNYIVQKHMTLHFPQQIKSIQ